MFMKEQLEIKHAVGSPSCVLLRSMESPVEHSTQLALLYHFYGYIYVNPFFNLFSFCPTMLRMIRLVFD